MKKILLTISLIAFFHTSLKAQWTLIESGTSAKLEAIHFMDSQNGFCSGGFVNILHTSDSGTTWDMSSVLGYRDFDFYSPTVGYATSRSGNSMGVTTNGGLTWTSLTPPTSNSLWGVSVTGSSTAYFVGTGGVLWKTSNSGASFTVLNSGSTDLLTDIDFTNSTTGFILSQTSGIKKTSNSGTSWTTVYTSANLMTEMCFVNDNVGYAVGSGGSVVKTANAGLTWSVLTTNSTSYLQGVHFIDENNGIVVGTGGTILFTNDGGENWDLQNSGTTEHLFDVRMLSVTSAIVTGDNGIILKNDTIVLGIEDYITESSLVQLYPNPTSNQLTISSNKNNISRIDIIDVTGNTVKSITRNYTSINIVDLQSGVYFARLAIDDSIITKKFIKQ